MVEGFPAADLVEAAAARFKRGYYAVRLQP